MTISKMWKVLGVTLLLTLLFTLLTSCASHRRVVPETFPFQFTDPNPHQLEAAKKYGISVSGNTKKTKEKTGGTNTKKKKTK